MIGCGLERHSLRLKNMSLKSRIGDESETGKCELESVVFVFLI